MSWLGCFISTHKYIRTGNGMSIVRIWSFSSSNSLGSFNFSFRLNNHRCIILHGRVCLLWCGLHTQTKAHITTVTKHPLTQKAYWSRKFARIAFYHSDKTRIFPEKSCTRMHGWWSGEVEKGELRKGGRWGSSYSWLLVVKWRVILILKHNALHYNNGAS